MNRWQAASTAALLSLTLGLAACSDDKKNPTAPEPAPEVPTVTTNFMGTVGQNGRDCNNFSMTNPGDIRIEVKDFSPLLTVTMGLSLGQPDASLATGCSTLAEDRSVRVFQSIASAGLAAGTYCTCIFDVGNVFPGETISYDLEVQHPE